MRSCAALAVKADNAPLGGVNYAGTVSEWRQVCDAAALVSGDGAEGARGFFESEFVPYRVVAGSGVGLFRVTTSRSCGAAAPVTTPTRHRSTVFPVTSSMSI